MRLQVIIACLLLSTSGYSQASFKENYQMLCFCSADDYTPDHIITLENNLEIVLQLLKPLTKGELKKTGIKFTDDQLKTLESWNLIKNENQRLSTNFPVIRKPESNQFYEEAKHYARSISDALRSLFVDYTLTLNEHNLESHSFPILFSYILDDQVWKQLEKEKFIRRREFTSGGANFWSGEFWMIEGKREFTYGTSSIHKDNMTMVINWNNETLQALRSLLFDTESLDSFLEKISANEKITDANVYKRFSTYGLIGNRGKYLIPVLDETLQNKLAQKSEELSQEIVGQLKKLPLEDLVSRYSFGSKEQALIVVYHEIMLDVIDDLTNHAIVTKPKLFVTDQKFSPYELSNVIFLVKHR